jgi:hypothetical protein
VVLDTSIERVEKRDTVFVVHTRRADGIEMVFEVDDVIAATGFTAPLQDLPKSGVATFGQSRLPAQTEYWESATSPGIFFAGTLTQAAHGLRKHGIPSNSGAVQGYRYNARVLARHLAETRFNQQIHRELVNPAELAKRLLKAASWSPELWHQRSYLAQVFSVGAEIRDEGTVPLTAFLDSGPPNGVAVTLESNGVSDPYPAIYLRRSDAVSEHLLEPNVMLDFLGPGYLKEVDSLLSELLRPALQAASR